ncbi:hypothetical protein Tco_1487052, partial [Tanacetum coccineum]
KEAMSHEETEDKASKSDSDAKIKLTGSIVKSSKMKRIKKFAYSTKELVKDDMDKKEVEMGKKELVDLLCIDVVTNVYNAKMKSTKKYKSLVPYEDHLTRTVLNEPSLEIFFRLHQGPSQDDLARTFRSFLLAEVEKRNKNPLKQMRAMQQLRSSSIFTSVYVAVQKLKKTLARASVQLG